MEAFTSFPWSLYPQVPFPPQQPGLMSPPLVPLPFQTPPNFISSRQGLYPPNSLVPAPPSHQHNSFIQSPPLRPFTLQANPTASTSALPISDPAPRFRFPNPVPNQLLKLAHFEKPQSTVLPNIYIRLLPPNTTDATLFHLGSHFGRVLSVRVLTEELNNVPVCRGVGFILFETLEVAEAAIDGINGMGFEASLAQESVAGRLSRLADTGSSNLYLTNLPKSYNELDLVRLFAPSMPKSVRILREPVSNPRSGRPGVSRGIAFARLDDRKTADAAIKKLRDLVLPGSPGPLRIRYADSVDQRALKNQIRAKKEGLNVGQNVSTLPSSPPIPIPALNLAQHAFYPASVSSSYSLQSLYSSNGTRYSISSPNSSIYPSPETEAFTFPSPPASYSSPYEPNRAFHFPQNMINTYFRPPDPSYGETSAGLLPSASLQTRQSTSSSSEGSSLLPPTSKISTSLEATPTRPRYFTTLPIEDFSTMSLAANDDFQEEGSEEEDDEEKDPWLGPVSAWNSRWATQRKSLP